MKARTSPSRWDEEILFTNGDDYFHALLEAIDTAHIAIELETYIFDHGVIAERLTEHLLKANERQVEVRIVVDGLGSPNFVHEYWPRFKEVGIEVRFFRSIPWLLKRLPGDPESLLRRGILRLRQANRGNHRKFCLIDNQQLWVGSFNVSDVHLSEVNGENAWKDVGVAVRGPDIKYAERAFKRAFKGGLQIRLPARSPKLLLLNDSFLHKRRARLEHLTRTGKAQTRIWLATPYFVPVAPVYRRLIKRAKDGIDVRIIIPRKNDVWFIKWMSVPLLKRLAAKGVKVYVYEPRFSHQKLFIIDDFVVIGSTNLNHRSFLHDLEMDVVITHPLNQTKIIDGFVQDQKLSAPFDNTIWARLPFWQRVLSSIFLLAKYWS